MQRNQQETKKEFTQRFIDENYYESYDFFYEAIEKADEKGLDEDMLDEYSSIVDEAMAIISAEATKLFIEYNEHRDRSFFKKALDRCQAYGATLNGNMLEKHIEKMDEAKA